MGHCAKDASVARRASAGCAAWCRPAGNRHALHHRADFSRDAWLLVGLAQTVEFCTVTLCWCAGSGLLAGHAGTEGPAVAHTW